RPIASRNWHNREAGPSRACFASPLKCPMCFGRDRQSVQSARMRGKAAIILSSGGLDSTTCLAIARAEGFLPLYSLSFDYGQRHRQELSAAKRIAQVYRVKEHQVIQIDLRQFGQSALTDDISVPKDRDE